VQPVAAVAGFGAALAAGAASIGPRADPAQVVTLLQTAGFGAIGLVSLVFSLLFLVVQWVSTTLSPRLILFRRSRLVVWTIAAALGLFTYSLTAAIRAGTQTDVPVLVPALAGIGALVVIGMLWRVQTQALRWVQVSSALSIIAVEGGKAIDQVHPAAERACAPLPPRDGDRRVVEWDGDGQILQRIDTGPLLRAASAFGAVVVFRVPIGTPMRDRLPIADVWGTLAARAVRRAVVAGTDRTLDQDPSFALRLLADVALRALSPAVNDPATAVQALDAIHSLLQRAGARDLSPIRLADPAGVVRVVIPVPDWEDLLTTGFDDVLIAATDAQPMVTRSAERLLVDLLDDVPAGRRDALRTRLAALRNRPYDLTGTGGSAKE
jgi:uncharacterized membrane protein